MTRLPVTPGYESLASVLDEALAHAQSGKGKERHATGRSFEHQPIVTICQMLGSHQGDLFQAIKKTQESVRLKPGNAIHELLGAINYLAAAVIQLRGAEREEALSHGPCAPDQVAPVKRGDAQHDTRPLTDAEYISLLPGDGA